MGFVEGSVTRLAGRREYFRVGLMAESNCHGWRECGFCMEQKSALLPTSSLATPHNFIKLAIFEYKGSNVGS